MADSSSEEKTEKPSAQKLRKARQEGQIPRSKDMGLAETSMDFDSPLIAAEIAHDEQEANKIANGVPLFVFNNKFHLSGAREVAAFEKALLDAAIDVAESFDDAAGASCGIDGCAI